MVWHDCKTDPPKKDGCYIGYYGNKLWGEVWYYFKQSLWKDTYDSITFPIKWAEIDLSEVELMNIYEKQKIASIARTLITELEFCDDEEFVELVLECVTTANPVPLEPEYL